MAIDAKIESAIRQAVTKAGQSGDVADKLIAWISDLAGGNAKITDSESVRRHLQLLFSTLEVPQRVNGGADRAPQEGA